MDGLEKSSETVRKIHVRGSLFQSEYVSSYHILWYLLHFNFRLQICIWCCSTKFFISSGWNKSCLLEFPRLRELESIWLSPEWKKFSKKTFEKLWIFMFVYCMFTTVNYSLQFLVWQQFRSSLLQVLINEIQLLRQFAQLWLAILLLHYRSWPKVKNTFCSFFFPSWNCKGYLGKRNVISWTGICPVYAVWPLSNGDLFI